MDRNQGGAQELLPRFEVGCECLSAPLLSGMVQAMPRLEFIDNVRRLIVSNAGHDQVAFRRSAEAIIRDLSVSNRPSEAKVLREALQTTTVTNGATTPLTGLNKHVQGLVSFISRSSLDQLFFSRETQTALDRVLAEYRGARRLAEGGFKPKTRLLFWGPPGCGKTAAAQWLASELSLQCGVVRLGSLITSFVGETGSNLQKVLSWQSRRQWFCSWMRRTQLQKLGTMRTTLANFAE